MFEVFWQFFKLGLVSFGGPAAHLGYFQRRFVQQLGWLSQSQYSQLVALSQLLPGPGSSQVGFAIGHQRAGLAGGIAAFVGFTLPSFALLLALALGYGQWQAWPWSISIIAGLKLVALVVVADAVWQMANAFCRKPADWLLAALVAAVMLVSNQLLTQLLALATAALWGWWSSRTDALVQPAAVKTAKLTVNPLALLCLLAFSGYLLWPSDSALGQLAADFYQAGALVFGGGHVVLPLLQSLLADSLSNSEFLTGYAAAQVVPGPMFTMATYLGAMSVPEDPVVAATIVTIAIFLPGLLLTWLCLDSWQAITQRPRFAAVIAAVNTAVVGLLFSALYQPVFVSAVNSGLDLAIAALALVLLRQWRWPLLAVIALTVVAKIVVSI
ncbi:chromate efflux transporter [Ferrimonas senticii]|uniref:chromate efflux transporter n=1 Tax=Ferrimonas senticii TaxID=394566 RepID=UPI00040CD2BC|nr:chromate efflux transporter [Ferrimonas senticii]